MNADGNEIAIIGLAGRFPGAACVEEFWRNLRDGVESITTFSPEEVEPSVLNPLEVSDAAYVRAGAVLPGADLFDAPFFGMSARDAEITDPQHRLMLECAWEALESAGYDSARYAGRVGVFCACGNNGYLTNNLLRNPDVLYDVDRYQATIGNDKDYVATRVAYAMNLRGPSLSVQTACSSSLVAVHLARQSLLAGECDMALAGGVALRVPLREGHLYKPGSFVSRDGHTRAFDADADGTMFTSAVGVVVLKRLGAARADADRIRAVVKGSAVNNDGSDKGSYTAPSRSGQVAVYRQAMAAAGVTPETITCVEAHGTATPTGDPIEVAALTEAFADGAPRAARCALGTVKTNIGHANTASGMSGLIKMVLSLEHGQLPASLHYRRPNPAIDFAASPFYVNAALQAWLPAPGAPRRAMVNSLGVGGTNACVVLDEAPPADARPAQAEPEYLLTVSARSARAMETACRRLGEYLRQNPQADLRDVCYTLHVGRRAFRHRRAIVCRSAAQAIEALSGSAPGAVFTGAAPAWRRHVVFLFSGMASEHVHMAADLYRGEAQFRRAFDECADLLQGPLGLDLRQIVYPAPGGLDAAARVLSSPAVAPAAVFAASYALATLWMSWGVVPDAVIGHSAGELAAACLAGVFSLEDALQLAVERGRVTDRTAPGAMLLVALSEDKLAEHLSAEISLAAVNGPEHGVVSGSPEAIDALAGRLYERGVSHVRLPVARAYHSHLLDPAVPGLRAAVARVRRNRPAIPYYSGMTGALADEELTDLDYWVHQLRRPVRFARALAALDYQREPILLEVGPGQVLTDMARRALPRSSPASVLASCPNARDELSARAFALGVLGKLWLMGVPVDWAGFHAARPRRRVPLPTYPFERQRYWVSPASTVAAPAPVHAAAGKRADIGQWFYAPSWKRLAPISPVAPSPGQAGRWLVFTDARGLGSQVSARLAGMGHEVFTVAAGERFARGSGRDYTVNPAADDVAAVLADLAGRGGIPSNIVHLWPLDAPSGDGEEAFQASQQAGYYSLLALGKALAGQGVTQALTIHAFSAGAQAVCGLEELRPAAATLLGPCKVISQEYPNILCRAIDLEVIHAPVAAGDVRIEQCLAEVTGGLADRVTAWRGGYRWGQCFEPAPLPEAVPDGGLRPRGVYLITGGLGGIGLVVAEQLARSVQARLVLVGRTPLPQGADREAWLASHGPEDRTVRRLRAVERMEQLGAQVMTASADAGDRAAMQRVFQAARERFGSLHGVFHAAGVLAEWAFAPVPATGRRESEAHFGPKARGAFVLEELLSGQACEFCVLFSSISAVMGGLGYSGYAAGNAFLDAFAARANRAPGGPRWLSVNWDIWKLPDARAPLRASLAELAITPAEGAQAMLRLLSARRGGQVIVSTGDLQTRLDTWLSPGVEGDAQAAAAAPASSSVHPRPDLMTAYAAPEGDAQCAIAAVWQTLLGIDRVGAHDDFFELGGHSLLAIQAVSRLRKRLGVPLTVKAIFEHPTVAALAESLSGPAPADALIEQIEGLSEQEVRRLLTEEQG